MVARCPTSRTNYGIGGGWQAKDKTSDDVKIGENIILGGHGIQILFFGFFVIAAAVFNYRIRAVSTMHSKTAWQQHLFVLYYASAFIMVRSIFRIAEYVMGREGALLAHEYYFYIFDAALMFIVMVLFNVWHPSKIISKKHIARFMQDPESQNSEYPLDEINTEVPSKNHDSRRRQ